MRTTILVGLTLLITPGPADAAIIDSFDQTNQSIAATVFTGPVSNTAVAPEAIGGHRMLHISFIQAQAPPGDAQLDVFSGTLFLSNSAQTLSTAIVTWDAAGSGLGGFDLTEVGTVIYFELDVSYVDPGVSLSVTVTDGVGGVSTYSLPGFGVGTVQIPFSSFTPGADFTSVDRIDLTIDASSVFGADFGLDEVRTSSPPVPVQADTWGRLKRLYRD